MFEPPDAIGGQPLAVVGKIGHQNVTVGRSAFAIAQGVEFQHRAFEHAEGIQGMGRQRDHFHVRHGAGSAQEFYTDLVELAKPALLGPLVTEHGTVVKKLERQTLAQPARYQSAGDTGGAFGAQRDLGPRTVGEGVHLLGDDVRGAAKGPLEHLGKLEYRRRDFGVAVALGQLPRGLDDMSMAAALVGQKVVGAAYGLKLIQWRPLA